MIFKVINHSNLNKYPKLLSYNSNLIKLKYKFNNPFNLQSNQSITPSLSSLFDLSSLPILIVGKDRKVTREEVNKYFEHKFILLLCFLFILCIVHLMVV